jgi:uncharacterized protein YbaR (Trm112 family)
MTGESGQMANERGKNEPQVDPKLLELLACPLTKAPLSWDPELAYPVRGGIPIMLPSEARALGADEG